MEHKPLNINVLQEKLKGSHIFVSEFIDNTKASEYYVRTRFVQDDGFTWDTVVPYEYRRTNLELTSEDDIAEYLKSIKRYFTKESMETFKKEELKRGLIGGDVTKPFFDVLLSFKEEIENLPQNNNGARRIQDIKDAGYTIASVPNAKDRMTSRVLLPIPLHQQMGYEAFTPQFKARVLRLRNYVNGYEAKETNHKGLIPDHKFSEVRWDEDTKDVNPMTMTDEEIISKFQLLDNQRNEQKREVCRRCLQEKKRGTIYGIKFFYKGTEDWDANIPEKGKAAEAGCIGCPWYDIDEWRKQLNEALNNVNK